MLLAQPTAVQAYTSQLLTSALRSTVIISRQQRRMQVMRIRQRDDRYRKKKKKQQHGSTSSHHHNQAKQLHTEPAYRRKPNPIRRYDTDVLSPVRSCDLTFLSFSLLLLFSSHIFSPASHRVFGYCCVGFEILLLVL